MLKAFHTLIGHKSFFKPDIKETLKVKELPKLSSVKYEFYEILKIFEDCWNGLICFVIIHNDGLIIKDYSGCSPIVAHFLVD